MASTGAVSGAGGLDVAGLVQASTAVQQQKVEANQATAKQYEEQLQAYKELDEALSALDKAALDLGTNGTVLAANSSDPAVVTAQATGAGGDVGEHEVDVQQTATFHAVASVPLKDGLIPTKIAQPSRAGRDDTKGLRAARQNHLEDRLEQVQQRTQESARDIPFLPQKAQERRQERRVARLQENLDQVTSRQDSRESGPQPLRDAGDKLNQALQRFKPAEQRFQGPLRPGAPSPDLIMGPGALWISVGGKGFLVNVTPGNMTLGEVADAINTADGNKGSKGVTASVVYGTEGARLVLRANEAGADREVKVQALAIPGSGLAVLDSRRMETLSKGQEAIAMVDGVEVKGRNNTLSNVIPGVTLTIAGPGKATVKVQADSEKAKESLQAFTEAYNAYRMTIDQLAADVLKNDLTLTTVRNDITNALITPPPVQNQLSQLPAQVANVVGRVPVVGERWAPTIAALPPPGQNLQQRLGQTDNQYQYLAEIGVTLQKDGTMKVDEQALDTALSANPGAVNALLTAPVTSAGSRVDRAIRQLRGTQGAVYNAENQLKENQRTNQRQAEQLNQDLQEAEEYYTQKFSDLNATLSQASATSNMVAQRLGGVPTTGAG